MALNPGSNSLKFQLVDTGAKKTTAGQLPVVASATIDGVGKKPRLGIYRGREVVEEQEIEAADMQGAVRAALRWLQQNPESAQHLQDLEFAAVRVVHGGDQFDQPAAATEAVLQAITDREELAPLHNKSALETLSVLREEMPDLQRMVVFDTAFHRTLPESAWRYPIERETADRFGIRKFGFHGLSHRYMLGEYARAVGKQPEECTIVTLHLESGSSACAIRNGQSVDTTMGLTPLEGLMMGSRCGSVDPAIVPYLMGKMETGPDEVMKLLEKKSGLLGVAGDTLDTRELVKRDDRWAKLALDMYSYRVRLAVGAYLAALGEACEAVIFGGGIGEDSPWLREAVCAGLGGWGLVFDSEANARLMQGQGRITAEGSRLQAWGMAVEEGLEIVWECSRRS